MESLRQDRIPIPTLSLKDHPASVPDGNRQLLAVCPREGNRRRAAFGSDGEPYIVRQPMPWDSGGAVENTVLKIGAMIRPKDFTE